MFLWRSKQQADRLFPERLVDIYIATSHTREFRVPYWVAALFSILVYLMGIKL